MDGVASVDDPVLNESQDTAVLTAVPDSAPSSSETKELVQTIRDEVTSIESDSDADIFVTGVTA